MTRPPRFILIFTVAVVLGLVITAVVAVAMAQFAEREERRDCARAIASRDDSRAMWLYLIDTATENPERVRTFALKLDELLPDLRCEGGNWVPDRD